MAENGESVKTEKLDAEENDITGKENIDLSIENNSLNETERLDLPVDVKEEIHVYNEKLIKPFKYGWSREVVERATPIKGKRMCDVYYRSPDGTKKLRSLPEVGNYLNSMKDTSGLTCENFSFYKRHIYREPFEIIRKAKERPPSKTKSPRDVAKSPRTPKCRTFLKNTGFIKKSPSKSNALSPKSPKLKRNVLFKQNLLNQEGNFLIKDIVSLAPFDVNNSRNFIQKNKRNNKVNSVNKLRTARPFTYSQKRNGSSGAGSPCKKFKNNGIDEMEIQLCSEHCPSAIGELPSLQCSICLCLFHPSCTSRSEKSSSPFTCKRCCDTIKTSLRGKLKNLMKNDNESSPKTDESLTDDEGLANVCVLSPEVVLQHEGSDQDDALITEKPLNQKPTYESSIQNSYWNVEAPPPPPIRQMPPLKPASQLMQHPGLVGKKITVASTFFPPCIPTNSQIRILAVPTSNLRMPSNQQKNNSTIMPQPPPLRLPHTSVIETSKLSGVSSNRFIAPSTANTRLTRPLILQKNSNQCIVLAPQNNIVCSGTNHQILGPFPASSLPQLLAIGNKLVCITSSNQPTPNGNAPIQFVVPRPQETTQGSTCNSKPNVNIPVNSETKSTNTGEVPSQLSMLLSNPTSSDNPYRVQVDSFKTKLNTSSSVGNSTNTTETTNKTLKISSEVIANSVILTNENGKPNVSLMSSGNSISTDVTTVGSLLPYNTTVTTIGRMDTTTTPAITSPMTTSRVSSNVLVKSTVPALSTASTPIPRHILPLNPLPPLQIFTSDISEVKVDITKCNQNIIKCLLSPSKSISSPWQEESVSTTSISNTKELHVEQQEKQSEPEMVELKEKEQLESRVAELQEESSESRAKELQEKHHIIRPLPNRLSNQNFSYFSGLNMMTACYNSLNIVFSYLDIIDLLRSRLVCKTWHTLSSQPFLWKSISLKGLCITNWKRFAIAVEIHSTRYLDMKGMKSKGKPYDMWRNFVDYLNYFENITYIDLGQAPTFVVYGIAEILLNLKTLKAECVQLGRRDSPNCSINFTLLKKLFKLEFLQLRAVDGFVTQNINHSVMPLQRFIKLKHLSITTLRNVESKHFKFLENLKLLEVLEIGDCYNWKSENFLCLRNLTKLRKLRIEKMDSTEGLIEALSNLTLLERLHLICCKTPLALGSALKKLQNLKFFAIWPDTSSCASNVNSNTLQAVISSKTLQELHWVILSADGTPEEPSNKETLEDCVECRVDFDNASLSLPFEDECCKKLRETRKSSVKQVAVQELADRLCKELPSTKIKFFRVPSTLMDKYCALK